LTFLGCCRPLIASVVTTQPAWRSILVAMYREAHATADLVNDIDGSSTGAAQEYGGLSSCARVIDLTQPQEPAYLEDQHRHDPAQHQAIADSKGGPAPGIGLAADGANGRHAGNIDKGHDHKGIG